LEILQQDVSRSKYYLLQFNFSANELSIQGFRQSELDQATATYGELERRRSQDVGRGAVLVSVDSLESLRRAYPNYFLDTTAFVAYVREIVG